MQSEVLSGWKDIANYLGKGVRTVQRYERELGLPIHRPSGRAKGSVIATQSELDAWVASCRTSDRTQLPSADSTLQACASLKDRIAKMDELTERMNKLRSEIRDSRDALYATIQRIHHETVRKVDEYERISARRVLGKRLG